MDFDGDGRLDILSGSWPGELYFFRNGPDGKFLPAEIIKGTDGKPLNPGNASTVFAVDYDNDGDLDLLCGTIGGEVVLYLNEGTRTKPSFSAVKKLTADGRVIRVNGGDSHPVFADWDSDGKQDLIVGTGAGGVMFYRNIGTREAPRFAAGKALLVERDDHGQAPEGQKKEGVGTRVKVCVCDYNGDGRLDLLVGDFSMTRLETAKLKDGTIPKSEAHKEAEKKFLELLKKHKSVFEDLRKATTVPDKETPQAKAARETKLKDVQAKVQKVFEEGRPYQEVIAMAQTKLEYYGSVWLLQRK